MMQILKRFHNLLVRIRLRKQYIMDSDIQNQITAGMLSNLHFNMKLNTKTTLQTLIKRRILEPKSMVDKCPQGVYLLESSKLL